MPLTPFGLDAGSLGSDEETNDPGVSPLGL